MKLFLFYIVLSFLPICAWSHQMDIEISELTESDTLTILEDDTCIFKSINGSKANWKLKLWKEDVIDGPYLISVAERANTPIYSLNVDNVNVRWSSIGHFFAPHDPTKFIHKGVLEYDDGYMKKNIYLNFDILPPKPKIKNVKFLYDSFDEKDFEFRNSRFIIDLEAEKSDYMVFLVSEFEASKHEDLWWRGIVEMRNPPDLVGISPHYQITYEEYWYWDIKYTIYSYNKYGHSVESDTIYTCDYILDERVRAAFLNASGVEQITQNDIDILRDGMINVSTIVKGVTVYDINGRLIKKANGGDSFHLNHGMYIIKGVFNNERSFTKKIMI